MGILNKITKAIRKTSTKKDPFFSLPCHEKIKILREVSREADKMQDEVLKKYNYAFNSENS